MMSRLITSLRGRMMSHIIRCYASTAADSRNKNLLKLLRKETGYPLINCKQALQISEYDYEKAKAHLLEIAKQKGLDKLESQRSMQQGLISLVHNKTSAVMLEVSCETDFVAKTLQFQQTVKNTADLLLERYQGKTDNIKTEIPVEEILNLELKDNQTVKDNLILVAGKLRENIQIRRALMVDVASQSDDLHIGGYVHPSVLVNSTRPNSPLGLYAAVVVFSFDNIYNQETTKSSTGKVKLIGRDLAQHIVGMNPSRVGKAPKVKMVRLVDEDGAPTSGGEKVERRLPVEGSRHLLKQGFLLESDLSVAEWLNHNRAQVKDFTRYRVAETIEENE